MSLYSLEEVCEGCAYARWVHGEKRNAFDFCEIEAESGVDDIRGYCSQKRRDATLEPGETK